MRVRGSREGEAVCRIFLNEDTPSNIVMRREEKNARMGNPPGVGAVSVSAQPSKVIS